jgi:hypothetical protein
MKRKKKRTMSPEELKAWRRRGEEQVRKLRELAAKAELEASRSAEASGQ